VAAAKARAAYASKQREPVYTGSVSAQRAKTPVSLGALIGALPDATVTGRLTRIAPKATEKEGTTLFDVEAAIENPGGVTLRAGYSANADVVIQEKANVLLLPERLVSFDKEKAHVEVPGPGPDAQPVKKEIKTGLSDGLKLEIVAGLAEGDQVVQRPPKEIR